MNSSRILAAFLLSPVAGQSGDCGCGGGVSTIRTAKGGGKGVVEAIGHVVCSGLGLEPAISGEEEPKSVGMSPLQELVGQK